MSGLSAGSVLNAVYIEAIPTPPPFMARDGFARYWDLSAARGIAAIASFGVGSAHSQSENAEEEPRGVSAMPTRDQSRRCQDKQRFEKTP